MKQASSSKQPIGGLPASVWQPGFDDVIVTPHGYSLHCKVEADSIAVFDIGSIAQNGLPRFFFSAEIEEHTYQDGARVMESSVCTRHPEAEPQRHPDLRAGALWGQALDYFDVQAPVTNVMGFWIGRLPTLAQEYNHYKQLLVKGEKPEVAVWDSFLGRMALRHGFTELHNAPRERSDWVVVNFRRPLALPAAQGI